MTGRSRRQVAWGVAAALCYGVACRHFNLRTLLVVCLSMATVANLAYLFYASVLQAQLVEAFNGFGYRNFGIHSPYLWAGTNNYVAGKYASDGRFVASMVDEQLGRLGLVAEAAGGYDDGVRGRRNLGE